MVQNQPEPSDHHVYSWVMFDSDTFHFYYEAVKYYESLLSADLKAIEEDKDLNAILGKKIIETFPINKELSNVKRMLSWFEGKLQKQVAEFDDYDVSISHGWVRFMKSVSLLYLKQLRLRRNILSSRPKISQHALRAIDQRISGLEETVRIGVFQYAAPIALLVDEISKTPTVPAQELTITPPTITEIRPRPVVLGSIEIFDIDLRKRCLDLFAQFKEDGEHDRLDTVVSEATRILENRLRQLSGASNELTGVELAKHAFGGPSPALIVSNVPAEQESAHLLFRGVFGFIRNSIHHRLVENLQAERVLQIVALIDYLLSIAEGSERKPKNENNE